MQSTAIHVRVVFQIPCGVVAKYCGSLIKQIVNFFFMSKGHSETQRVVLVEYPCKGIYSMGFVTNRSDKFIEEKIGKELLNILIPSVPNPLTGLIIIVPVNEVIFLDIGIEEAVKFFVSGGVVNPSEIIGRADTNSAI